MKFNQTVRNQPAPPTAQAPPAPAAGNVQTTPVTDIVQLLAQSEPQQQKQIIGEQLYRQIFTLHPEHAGKITGESVSWAVW